MQTPSAYEPPASQRAFSPFDPRQARGRLLTSAAGGAVAALVLGAVRPDASASLRAVAAWDAAALVYLALAWTIIFRSSPASTRCRAAAEDPGRRVVWLTVLGASTFSLFAAVGVLRQARTLEPAHVGLLIALSLLGVLTAWLLTHTSYALRYAHLYYRDDEEGEGGLEFPGQAAPDYFDVAYFAFTVGMCFQVSDVTISSRAIRRAVLGHALLSFAYTTAILALALNLAFGLLG